MGRLGGNTQIDQNRLVEYLKFLNNIFLVSS
jgi:hypothetical protein